MLEKEIKILWGRSGNRCAICKIELTPDGEKETLGEMAHIIAKSTNGPRGDSPLTSYDRDKYSNLILLCPTHHAEIDKNFPDWPVNKLLEIKSRHESWVSEQLNDGKIQVAKIDNTDFLANCSLRWNRLSRDHVAMVLSLTPLRVSDDQIDIMGQHIERILEEATLPGDKPVQRVNKYQTRPTEFGLVNEKFPELPKRFGHSYHIFRSGHCEYFQELGHDVDKMTEGCKSRGEDVSGAKYVIRYTDLAEVVDSGLSWLEQLWTSILPYEYMEFRCTILNTKSTTLYSFESQFDGCVFGHPTDTECLIYKDILSKEYDSLLLKFSILKWIANCFGLVLKRSMDSNGEFARPIPMR